VILLTVAGVVGVALTTLHDELRYARPQAVGPGIDPLLKDVAPGDPQSMGPSAKRRMRGRTYRVYRDGSHIRLVAWRTDQAVYWVSNTLSARLSDAQMLAVARSLVRVGQ
jgi:hypothetical protein